MKLSYILCYTLCFLALKINTPFITDIDHLDEVQELLKTSRFSERNWINLGLKFGLLKNTLETVEGQYGTNIGRCLLECLSLWLQRVDKVDEKGVPTWNSLADALSKLGDKKSAEHARQKGMYKY